MLETKPSSGDGSTRPYCALAGGEAKLAFCTAFMVVERGATVPGRYLLIPPMSGKGVVEDERERDAVDGGKGAMAPTNGTLLCRLLVVLEPLEVLLGRRVRE